jgi:hypothetical protein
MGMGSKLTHSFSELANTFSVLTKLFAANLIVACYLEDK